jgi:putative endonuclease
MSARGADAESLAAAFLQLQGLALVERNYRCRFGEIDLIARDGDTLVFVEVRMRSSERFGGAAASITAAKQQKLLRTARHYLAGSTRAPACRFDALLLHGENQSIEWLKNAFTE